MNKRIALLIVVLALLFSALACSNPLQAAEKGSQAVLILQEDFVDVTDWKINYDGHVDEVCPEITTSYSDISVESRTLPGLSVDGDDRVGQLIANTTGRPGQFVSVIASKPLYSDIADVEDGTYVAYGYAAAMADTKLELVDVSLEIVTMEDGKPTAYYGEVFLYLNDWLNETNKWRLNLNEDMGLRRHNGMTYTRMGPDDDGIIHLSDIGDDRQWHYWELEIDVDKSAPAGRQFMISRVLVTEQVNGEERIHILDLNEPMWREVKSDGYSTGMQVFLETQSMNTNCSAEHTFKGESLWDALTIVRYPLGEAPLMVRSR